MATSLAMGEVAGVGACSGASTASEIHSRRRRLVRRRRYQPTGSGPNASRPSAAVGSASSRSS